ncbi:hypothetical protein BCU85_08475 [Vibrio lentus]|uniref:hypothetical protein n=1 Tax=Vibrio lentus TaxID=136468 RepID=UPI000C83F968|nr:hypothetical protein [Vibrio lentus]MCC4818655.1 hypothetical protein [Vibrio lentus]PMG68721.1 hypothetical protein BCU85_08475 [Vibrio lentus]PML27023.1 hypothetical protein BCT80_00360 [Vibrio lentus]PMM25873.1 hypothetical protein BCT57_21955 [Vibrio lentus]PMM51468.1 hypothetical protein BCT53_01635 [Vibrio lentus]
MKITQKVLSVLGVCSLLVLTGCSTPSSAISNEPVDAENFVSELTSIIKIESSDTVAMMVASPNLDTSRSIENGFKQKLPNVNFLMASDNLRLNKEKAVEKMLNSQNPPDYVLFVLNQASQGYGCETVIGACNTAVKESSVKVALFNKEGIAYQALFDVETGGHDTSTVDGLLMNLSETDKNQQIVNIISQDLVYKGVIEVPIN